MVSPNSAGAPVHRNAGLNRSQPGICRTNWIGGKAENLLNAPGLRGEVIAVLPDVIYLAAGAGEILWLAGPGAPRHGRGIPAALPIHGLRAGQRLSIGGGFLAIDERPVVDLRQAARWVPRAFDPAGVVPFRAVRGQIGEWLQALLPAIRCDGPGGILIGIAALADRAGDLPRRPVRWRQRMLLPLVDLARHCLERGLSQIAVAGRGLVGLGPGLTPCGDDFLGGVLFALHRLAEAYPLDVQPQIAPLSDMLRWAEGRTHPISHRILSDLAGGQGPEPLHDLCRLLLSREGGGREAIAALDRLAAIGDTTGWSILAGMVTGLLAAEPPRPAAADAEQKITLPSKEKISNERTERKNRSGQ